MEAVCDIKPAPEVNYLLKLSPVGLKFVFRQVQIIYYFVDECSCYEVNLFVLRGEIASRNVSKCPPNKLVQKQCMIFEISFVARTRTYA